MKYLFFALQFFIPFYVQSQKVLTLQSAPKKLISQFDKASLLYKQNEFAKAEIAFQKILKKYPSFINAHVKLGSLYFETKNYSQAENYFNNALNLDSLFDPKIYYTLALADYSNFHFEKAKLNMAKFLNASTKYPELQQKAIAYYKTFNFADSSSKHPVEYQLQAVQILNSEYSEYLPTISADGKMIIFTRRINNSNEDLFMSTLKNDVWSSPTPIDNLNTVFNEGAPCLSSDGKKLLFSSCDRKSSIGGCDLYMSTWENDHWSSPLNLGDVINTPAYESNPCFANHDTQIYFASNRIGTLGGLDIFVTEKLNDNTWSKPKNLGPTINTPGNEDCPYVHADNHTLFYSSNGHTGMGGKDIFVSHRSGITQPWNKPVNLGFPINSIGDDASMMVDHTGKIAFVSSDKAYLETQDKKRNIDIYSFELPEHLRPTPTALFTLSILDEQTKLPVIAEVKIFDLINHEIFFSGKCFSDGKIHSTLPTNVDYALHVTHKDYLFEPEQIEKIESDQEGKQVERTIILHKKSKNEKSIILKNVLFETNSAQLKPESEFDLEQLYIWLKDHPEIRIRITGHTDNIGNEMDNLTLSLERAKSVRHYIVMKGIAESRIECDGKGELQAIDTNETESGRKNNRRTEFIIL